MSIRPLKNSLRLSAIAAVTIALSLCAMSPAGGDVVVAQNLQRQCQAEGEYRALDPVVLLGSEVKSEIFFRVHDCPKVKGKPVVYVVVALDFARTLDARDVDDMTSSANSLLKSLDKSAPSRSKFGVVAFNGRDVKTCEFSSDAGTLRGCTGLQPAPWPATDIGKGLEKASQLFKHNDIPNGARSIIVLFSDAAEAQGAACPRSAGGMEGITVMTVGVGSNPNASCLRHIASSNNLYFEGSEANMHRVKEAALYDVENELEAVVITNTIAANMHYIEGSAEPRVDKEYWDGDEYVLIWKNPWKNTIPPDGGMTLSFTVKPHHAGGSQPISRKIVGSYAETVRKGGLIPFGIPRVAVMGPEQTTPTAPPTPVATEPPTSVPVEPTATSAATEDMSPRIFSLHFPLLQKSEFCPRCADQNRYDPFRP